jgi:hypothetical protein
MVGPQMREQTPLRRALHGIVAEIFLPSAA